jgi:hypothetical protein
LCFHLEEAEQLGHGIAAMIRQARLREASASKPSMTCRKRIKVTSKPRADPTFGISSVEVLIRRYRAQGNAPELKSGQTRHAAEAGQWASGRLDGRLCALRWTFMKMASASLSMRPVLTVHHFRFTFCRVLPCAPCRLPRRDALRDDHGRWRCVVMGGLFVLPALMMFGGLRMVARCVSMMFCSIFVVFGGFFGHDLVLW